MDSHKNVASIIEFTRELVRVPSQGGIDSLDPIIDATTSWLSDSKLKSDTLVNSNGRPVGVLVRIESGRPGPIVCLDAPIDTAPVGRTEAWSVPPFGGVVQEGRMYGRGVADAKVAVSLFCHLARELRRSKVVTAGAVHVLLDGDEHTGHFGGVRAYLQQIPSRPDFVAIGYPGNWGIKIGARGFYRTKLCTFGEERHSGARADTTPQNAIVKMAHLIRSLSETRLPVEPDPDFGFGPKLSITSISGGAGYSQIPGQCVANLDVRLTPGFSASDAKRLIEGALATVDEDRPTSRPSGHNEDSTWPPYRLEPNSSFVTALRTAAESAFKRRIETAVVGPSNIGNYLASLGVPATCGFGVSYDNQHAADEYIEVDTIAPVCDTYHRAVMAWCSSSDNAHARNADLV